MTQKQLSEKMQVNQTAVSQWETCRCNPSMRLLPALAAALGCSIDELFAEPTERAQESAGGEAAAGVAGS